MSYRPLCVSGVVYKRELNIQFLLFGNTSALYQSDLVMYGHQSDSYWFQVGGEAVVGELIGAHLDLLSSTTVAWMEWKALYPDTKLLVGTADSPVKFSSRSYGQDFPPGFKERIDGDQSLFPVDSYLRDRCLGSGDLVLTVEVDGSDTAYPRTELVMPWSKTRWVGVRWLCSDRKSVRRWGRSSMKSMADR